MVSSVIEAVFAVFTANSIGLVAKCLQKPLSDVFWESRSSSTSSRRFLKTWICQKSGSCGISLLKPRKSVKSKRVTSLTTSTALTPTTSSSPTTNGRNFPKLNKRLQSCICSTPSLRKEQTKRPTTTPDFGGTTYRTST